MRWLGCFVVALLLLALVPGWSGAQTPGVDIFPNSSALLSFWDGPILGNRARMIQVACVGMVVAIFILTRGHRQGK